jgi:hypothetical protein
VVSFFALTALLLGGPVDPRVDVDMAENRKICFPFQKSLQSLGHPTDSLLAILIYLTWLCLFYGSVLVCVTTFIRVKIMKYGDEKIEVLCL